MNLATSYECCINWLYLNWEGQVDAFGGDVQLYQKLVFSAEATFPELFFMFAVLVMLFRMLCFRFPTEIHTREELLG